MEGEEGASPSLSQINLGPSGAGREGRINMDGGVEEDRKVKELNSKSK